MTAYVVLTKNGEEDSWGQVGPESVPARSARAAISQVLSTRPGSAGKFVAVPARSWQPVTVTPETKTTLKFSA